MKRSEVLQLFNLTNPALDELLARHDKKLYGAQEIPDDVVEMMLLAKEKSAQPKQQASQVSGGAMTPEQETIANLQSGDRAYRDIFSVLRNQGIQRGVTAGVLTGTETLRAYAAGEAQALEEIGQRLIEARRQAMGEIYDNPLDQVLGELGVNPVAKTMGAIASSIPKLVKPCLPSSYLSSKS